MNAKRDQIYKWADGLEFQEARELITDLVHRMMEIEEVRFWESNLAPYWESCGEPLVPGQKPFKGDDE